MGHHFLFVMWDGGGTVAPELGIARQLIERGHRVTVLGDPAIQDEASAAGAAFVPYRTAGKLRTEILQDWETADPTEAISRVIDRIMCGPALEIARDVVNLHENDPIDCVAGCAFLFGAIIGAESAGVRSVVLFPNLDFRPAPGRPGFGPGLHPLDGPEGQARDAEIWNILRELFARGQPALDGARRALGLETTSHPWDEFSRADCVLLLTSRHFEYPYQVPPRTFFAGPVLDDPSWAVPTDATIREDRRPLVLASLGSSFQNQLGLYQRIALALGDLAVDGVVTLGGVFEPEELQATDNVQILKSAPHRPLLERAAVFVSHCGHGSVMKALAAGVPMLCLPISREQPENAARVEWHGAGLRLDPNCTSVEIREALGRLLAEDHFQLKAQEMSRKIRTEIEDNVAARELERVAGSGKITTGFAHR